MSPKQIRWLFFGGVAAISLHFSIRFGSEALQFFLLRGEARAQISQWEIVPIHDRFALKASYGFESQKKTWHGSFILSPPYHLNEPAALSALKAKAKQNWTVWYNPNNPANSALEKHFPVGLLIRALVSYAVLSYFFYLYKVAIRV